MIPESIRRLFHRGRYHVIFAVLLLLVTAPPSTPAFSEPLEPFLVRDIQPGADGSGPLALINVNGTLFFWADDGIHGTELWKSDGTEAGTVLVRDINPGAGNSGPSFLTNVNGTLFFEAYDGTHGEELWKSDGTAAGTVLIDIVTGVEGSSPQRLTNVNGTLFFTADNGINGRELWALRFQSEYYLPLLIRH